MNFAVIETGGKQYKVKEGDIIKIDKIEPSDQKKAVFDKVLLLAENDESVKIGQPYLENAKVEAEILEQGRSEKVTVIKFKAKVRYRKKRGYHPLYTKIKITKI
ncbi:MAG: large subunit ribosomal protein L21 [Parcubacteria group bacterium Athens0714_12]|nr:MAG: large subunit ribosomal protein L21 [Parcubacteria group bacterium Athens0714_12]